MVRYPPSKRGVFLGGEARSNVKMRAGMEMPAMKVVLNHRRITQRITTIFAKLEVGERSEAIARARAAGSA